MLTGFILTMNIFMLALCTVAISTVSMQCASPHKVRGILSGTDTSSDATSISKCFTKIKQFSKMNCGTDNQAALLSLV